MSAKPVLRYRHKNQIIQLWYGCGTNIDEIVKSAKITGNPANKGANLVYVLADIPDVANGGVVTRLFVQPYVATPNSSKTGLIHSVHRFVGDKINTVLEQCALKDITFECAELGTIAWAARFSFLASNSGIIFFSVFALLAALSLCAAPASALPAASLLLFGAVGGIVLHGLTHSNDFSYDGAFSFS